LLKLGLNHMNFLGGSAISLNVRGLGSQSKQVGYLNQETSPELDPLPLLFIGTVES
jgi:hypothetical protein